MKYPVMKILFRGLLLCGVFTGAAASADESARTDGDSVRITWLSDCRAEASVKFFALELLADGTLLYEGFAGVRTIGTVTQELDRSASRKIRAAAVEFLSNQTQPSADSAMSADGFCVQVESYVGGAVAKSRSQPASLADLPELLRTVDRHAPSKRWLCPARKLPSADGFEMIKICAEEPAVTLTLGGRTACDLTQHMEVYSDGTVYSMIYVPSGSTVQNHAYHRVNPAEVERLVKTINSFEAVTLVMEQPRQNNVQYIRTKPDDIAQLRSRLAELAPIAWAPSSGSTECTEPAGPRSSITLRRDLDRAVNAPSG